MKYAIHSVVKSLIAVTAVAGLLLVGTGTAFADKKAGKAQQQLVGLWSTVSVVNVGKDGAKSNSAFGTNPKGQFIFTKDGHYLSINTRPELPKFASGNRMQGTPEENKAIVQGSIAHFGTYSVSGDGKTFTIKVEGGSWPSWTGAEQTRSFTVKGDELKYTVNASTGGTAELVYKRVK